MSSFQEQIQYPHDIHDIHQGQIIGHHQQEQAMGNSRPVSSTGSAREFLNEKAVQYDTPFYKKRKYQVFCLVQTPIIIVVTIVLSIFVIFPIIAQTAINGSHLIVQATNITNPQNTTFGLSLKSIMTNTGPFPAKITFSTPIQVFWKGNQLGVFELHEPVYIKGGHGTLNQATQFNITDVEQFTKYSTHMITDESFTWTLKATLNIVALSIHKKGLTMNKDIVMNGMNGFQNSVKILDFQLPANDPSGGIALYVKTQLINHSPFQIPLGFTEFGLSYNGTFLAPAFALNQILVPGNNTIPLYGRLLPQTAQNDLDTLGNLFTNYVNNVPSFTFAQGIAAYPDNKTAVGWLTEGLRALNMSVPLLAPKPLTLIKGIDIGTLDMAFTPPTAYSPETSSDNVTVHFDFPFGFTIAFQEISNSFSLIDQSNQSLASLSSPYGKVKTDFTKKEIYLSLPSSSLAVPNHTLFQGFTYDLTTGNGTGFNLSGSSAVKTMTPIGPLVMRNVKFNVISALFGLEGLTAKPTIINSIDVPSGTANYLELNVNTTIYNPSNLILSTGNVQFFLQYQNVTVGKVLLNNLTLSPGNNFIAATGQFDPNGSKQGITMLNDFVSGRNDTVNIVGYNASTDIDSLKPALAAIKLLPTLPGLQKNLVLNAHVAVPTTIGNDHIANSLVTIGNPFSGGLFITKIDSNVTSNGIFVGSIKTVANLAIPGSSNATSQPMPLLMNLNPGDVFSLLKVNAIKQGLNIAPLDALVQLGGITYTHAPEIGHTTKRDVVTEPFYGWARRAAIQADENQNFEKRQALDSNQTSGGSSQGGGNYGIDPAIFNNFNLPNFVISAFSNLHVDISLISGVKIGDYSTELSFNQYNVPAGIDDSINNLLPVLGRPIVQKIVDASILSFSTINIVNPTQNSFGTSLRGAITNTGPLAAEISFPDPVSISWNGQQLGFLAMPTIVTQPVIGAQLNMNAQFTVTNVEGLTDFTKFLLNKPSFVWEITANNVTVKALGANFTGITLHKSITLNGMNAFNKQVIIESFNLPANDPAGGITLTLQTALYNPSNIGIQVGNLGFDSFFQGVDLGPVAGSNVGLAPLSINQLALKGRLVYQSSPEGQQALSTMFTNFIHGVNSSLSVVGEYASPSGQNITWLNEGIKSLTISGIQLPGQVFQVIRSINILQMALSFTPETAYRPPTSSNDTMANYYIPFGFPLDITSLSSEISAVYNGKKMASLKILNAKASTDTVNRVMTFGFQNVPFEVASGQEGNFNSFAKALTISKNVGFGLQGVSDAVANTAAGIVTIKNIPIDVTTSLNGLEGLNSRPVVVTSLDVTGGTSKALEISLGVTLFNPSNLTLGIGDTTFDFMYLGKKLGTVGMKDLTLVPNNNSVSALALFMPEGDAVEPGYSLLSNFIQGVSVTTQVQGTQSSTNVASLKDGLAAISLNTLLPALHQNLVTAATVSFDASTISTNFGVAKSTFTLTNPFTASLSIKSVNATIHYNELYIGQILLNNMDFHAAGHSVQASKTEPLLFNMNIPSLVRFVVEAAAASKTDISVLIELFKYLPANDTGAPGITPSGPKKRSYQDNYEHILVSRSLGKRSFADGSGDTPSNPNVVALTMQALRGLHVNLTLGSTLSIGDYQTSLDFNQYNVPATVDNSISYLIQYLGGPIVQNIVDMANLSFTQANLFNLRENEFDIHLMGSLSSAGPVDAAIHITPAGLTVTYNNKKIGTIMIPVIESHGGQTTPLDFTSAHFTITDQSSFTEFIVDSLHNKQFTWTVSGPVDVHALGLNFTNVMMNKSVTLMAFNGLQGVSVSSFNAPRDASDNNGIEIEIGTLLPNPAQVGITLGTITFHNFFKGVYIGPIVANNVTLVPQSNSTLAFDGQIIPQTSTENLNNLGVLFSQYLAGIDSGLSVVGVEVTPPGTSGTEVKWLNEGFKTLNLSIVLPGNKTIQIVNSINISDMELVFNSDQSVLASSKNTVAGYKNPFGFSLGIGESAQSLQLGPSGNPYAIELDLPMTPCRTEHNDTLFISFTNKTLKILDESSFQTLTKQITDTASAPFSFNGTTNILALTKAGAIPITNIPVKNISTIVSGINSFGHTGLIQNVNVDGGSKEYMHIDLQAVLNNPSNLSVSAKDVTLDVHVGSPTGPIAGKAVISNFNLVPGNNTIPALFQYTNNVDPGARVLLSNFLEGNNTDIYINGNPTSSNVQHLIPALEGVSVKGVVPGVPGPKLIQRVTGKVDLLTIISTRFITIIDFMVGNPLNTSLEILGIEGLATHAGDPSKRIGTFSVRYNPGTFIVPAQDTKFTNPNPPTVVMENMPGLFKLLGMVGINSHGPYLKTDITLVNHAKVGGENGYEVTNLTYYQPDVTVYLKIGFGLKIKSYAESVSDATMSAAASMMPTGESLCNNALSSYVMNSLSLCSNTNATDPASGTTSSSVQNTTNSNDTTSALSNSTQLKPSSANSTQLKSPSSANLPRRSTESSHLENEHENLMIELQSDYTTSHGTNVRQRAKSLFRRIISRVVNGIWQSTLQIYPFKVNASPGLD